MKRTARHVLFSGGAALLLPATAFAQTATPVDNTGDSGSLNEMVVTARRVQENLQKVPVTVTSFNADSIARLSVTDTTDLSGYIPNVSVTKTGAGTGAVQIFIRGIGQSALAFNLESPVGTYVDDVYLGRIQGSLVNILDMQRVEVLRGPQGTLYGRNSTVGAVKYVTSDPDLVSPHLTGALTLGDYARVDANVFATAPIIKDQLAIKVDLASLYQQGYIKLYDQIGKQAGYGDRTRVDTARIGILWKPAPDWRVDLSIDGTKDMSGSSQGTPISCNEAGSSCAFVLGSPFRAGQNGAYAGRNDAYGASLKIQHDMNWATVKSITSARALKNFDAIDFTALPGAASLLPDHKNQNQYSEEIQLISKENKPLSWVGGLFFYNENIVHNDNFVSLWLNYDHQNSDSYAGYLNLNYKINDRLNIEAGGRYSKDMKDIYRQIHSYPQDILLYSGYGSFSTSAFTYKVGVNYNIEPNILGYATYSTGYRPGSFGQTYPGPAQIASDAVLTHLNNETANNIEVGLKTELFNRKLRLNGDFFYTKYDNLQTESSVSPYPVLSNNVNLSGVELETEARLTTHLTAYGNVSYLHGNINSGVGEGATPQYAPKWKYAVGGDYRTPLGGGVEVFVGAHLAYTSTFTTDAPPIPVAQLVSVTQRAYALLGAQIGADFGHGQYRISVDGKNLTNSVYFYGTSPGSEQFFGPPRMVFATFTVHY